jgi:ATP-dependent RNA helicase DeaD
VLLVPYPRRRVAERLLASARIHATWAAAPSAEEIHRRESERLVQEAIAAAETASAEPELVGLGRSVLEAQGAEAVAAALVRALGASLPAPEELEMPQTESQPHATPNSRAPVRRRDGDGTDEGIWFRLNVGHNRNADPRWLLPFLCRRGHVTRQEVGRIQVMERETRVEIASWAATRFTDAARHQEADDEDIRIEPMRGPAIPHGRGARHTRAASPRR